MPGLGDIGLYDRDREGGKGKAYFYGISGNVGKAQPGEMDLISPGYIVRRSNCLEMG